MFLVSDGVDGNVLTGGFFVGVTVTNVLTTGTFVAGGLTLTDLVGCLVSADSDCDIL